MAGRSRSRSEGSPREDETTARSRKDGRRKEGRDRHGDYMDEARREKGSSSVSRRHSRSSDRRDRHRRGRERKKESKKRRRSRSPSSHSSLYADSSGTSLKSPVSGSSTHDGTDHKMRKRKSKNSKKDRSRRRDRKESKSRKKKSRERSSRSSSTSSDHRRSSSRKKSRRKDRKRSELDAKETRKQPVVEGASAVEEEEKVGLRWQPNDAEESAKASDRQSEGDELKATDERASRARSMVPMSKAQYDAQQAIVREVYDPESGRYRLVRGTGEIIERIVTRDTHQQINRIATAGDGASFSRSVAGVASSRRAGM